MLKKSITLVVVIVILCMGISGCLEETENRFTVNASLKDLKLTLDDLEGDYQKFDEKHITKPYTPLEGMTFGGWKILEKYEVRFTENESNFIMQTLGRLKSKQKCEQFIKKIKNANLTYNFTEVTAEKIGEGSYLGKNTTTISDYKVTMYLLAFMIKDVVVVLLTSDLPMENIISYAHVIEKNINDAGDK